MIYIGTPGRMVEIRCPSAQQDESSDRYRFRDTLEGRRKAQVIPRSRRSWSLKTSDSSTPFDLASLFNFIDGAWGIGPFWFIPSDAPGSNILPPVNSVFTAHSDGGPTLLPEGIWAPYTNRRSDGVAGTIQFISSLERVPVIPGKPVTASAWVMGQGSSILLQWYSAAGSLISAISSSSTGGDNQSYRRVSASGYPPAGADYMVLTARNAIGATLPAVSLTSTLQPFGVGQGCAKAVVHGPSKSVVLAGVHQNYSSVNFKVTEVG